MAEKRTERVCVNPTEKKRLEVARKKIFGTESVPLGEVIARLMKGYEAKQ